MTRSRALMIAGLTLAALTVPAGALAGGGAGGGGQCAGFSSGSTLVMRDSCFDGVAHFAERGSTLVVENQGQIPHSFTAVDGSFDSGVLQPGQQVEVLVGEDGITEVWCTLHGSAHGHGMAGVLIVGDPVRSMVAAQQLGPDLLEEAAQQSPSLSAGAGALAAGPIGVAFLGLVTVGLLAVVGRRA